jgi:beta-glucosidase
MAVQFVKGMQGEHSKYLKTVSTPKHFAVHSGPDGLRHKFNAVASKKDMYETYLPAFRASVIEGGAKSIMCAYNRTNDVVCCGHNYLQQELLRDKWGFNGYIVSDCAAVLYFHKFHKVTASHAESVALAVKNGCDLNCGSTYNPYLLEAVKKGYITEPQIDVSVKRLMKARMQLGLFDPPEMVPYANIPYEVVDCPKHKQIALNAARESIILLKNDGLLPLNLSENLDIAVIGPNADAAEVQWGNYNGTPSQTITPLQGIRNKTAGRCDVTWALGTLHINNPDDRHDRIQRRLTEAVLTAERSDIVILCLGISSDIEGEAGSTKYPELAGDRADIKLPPGQVDLFKAVKATGKPIITVLMSGSVLQVAEIYDDCNAVIQQFYPGQAGGTAIADIIFGDVNPAGRLPVTCYKSTKDIPEITNYDMAGRTYRYFQGTPLFPFGFGLSYTSFRYSNLDTEAVYTDYSKPLELSVDVENTGSRAGDEVVQVYISHPDKPDAPLKQLVAFKRTNLERGSKKTVKLIIDPRCLAVVNQQGRHILSPGKVKIFVSGKLPCKRSDELCDTNVLSTEIMIEGPAKKLDI